MTDEIACPEWRRHVKLWLSRVDGLEHERIFICLMSVVCSVEAVVN